MKRLAVTVFALALLASCSKSSKTNESAPPKPGAPEIPPTTPAPGAQPKTQARKGVVSLFHLSAIGQDATSARKVLEHNLPAWQACYEKALATDPDLCGWMSAHVEHLRHGGFSHSFPAAQIHNATLSRCMSFDLRAPSKDLATPGVGYEFTLVFTPASKAASDCEPKGGLHKPDLSCKTDADCTAIYRLTLSSSGCCRGCNPQAVAKSWVPSAERACGQIGGNCPSKKCAALPKATCRKSVCALR